MVVCLSPPELQVSRRAPTIAVAPGTRGGYSYPYRSFRLLGQLHEAKKGANVRSSARRPC